MKFDKGETRRKAGLVVNATADEPSQKTKGKKMAHNIETFADGTAAFASSREVAWHQLGTVTENAMTAEEALEMAQLNWQVKVSEETISTEIDGQIIKLDGKYLTYRDHPKTGISALGVVGNRYTPIQNLEAFSFLNHLADETGAVFETAGSLKGGRQVFMSMKMPFGLTLNGADAHDMYIFATNSHDGSIAFTAAVTPIRVVCTNTVNMALRAAKSKATFKHTRNAVEKVQQARELLGLTFKYQEAFEQEVQSLLDQAMTDAQFEKFVEQMFPYRKGDDTSKRGVTKVDNKRNDVLGLWKAPTQLNIANTKWAAYNAVTEYADWFMPVRGDDEDRAERIVSGGADYVKDKAYALLTR